LLDKASSGGLAVRILFGEFALDRGSRQLRRASEEVHNGPKVSLPWCGS
jgi:hypothetical protein